MGPAARIAFASTLLLPVQGHAASPEAWQEFRAEVERACLALAASLEQPKVVVNPFGTESYGVAMLIGAERSGTAETYACIYDKRSKRAEISGPFDAPIE